MIKAKTNSMHRTFGGSRQAGVSLVELLVGIVISLIILSGVLATFLNMVTSSNTAIQSSRLNTELRTATTLIIRELQRAGYVNAWDPAGNAGEGALRLDAMADFGAITVNANCVIYHFDLPDAANPDGDGVLAGDGSETFGFRLSGGAIQRGTNVTCGGGAWQNITSDDISITALTFEIDDDDSRTGEDTDAYVIEGSSDTDTTCDATDLCLDRRKINIGISGQLASDANVILTLNSEVKLMNDRYYEES